MTLDNNLLDPVDAYLLALLQPTSPAVPNVCTLASEQAWQQLATKAADLAVGPLIYAALKQRAQIDAVPAPLPEVVMPGLREHAMENALRNFALYRQLRHLLDRFQTHGVKVIVLKGAYLAQAVYRDAALRIMSDIDLLIHAEERGRVRDLLAELGYRPERIETGAPERLHHDLYMHPAQPVSVEIHWALVSQDAPFQIDMDGLWARAEPVRLAGTSTLALSPVDLVLHLCIHMTFQHVCDHYCLRSLCDIQQVVERCGARIDWTVVCARAHAWCCKRNVHLALLLAQRLLAAAVPPETLEQLRPAHFDDRLVQWAAQRVLGWVDDRQGPWSANLGRWHLTTNLAERLALVRHICFPARQELARQAGLPERSPRVGLLYARHWAHLGLRSLKTLFGPASAASAQEPSGWGSIGWAERETGRIALVRWTGREHEGDRG